MRNKKIEEVEEYGSNGAPEIDPEELERIKGLGLKELLEEARMGAFRMLLLKMRNHEASAAELAVLRNLLRDNGLILSFEDTEGAPSGGGERPSAIGFHLPDLDTEEDE